MLGCHEHLGLSSAISRRFCKCSTHKAIKWPQNACSPFAGSVGGDPNLISLVGMYAIIVNLTLLHAHLQQLGACHSQGAGSQIDQTFPACAGDSAGGNLAAVMTLIAKAKGIKAIKSQVRYCLFWRLLGTSGQELRFVHNPHIHVRGLSRIEELVLQVLICMVADLASFDTPSYAEFADDRYVPTRDMQMMKKRYLQVGWNDGLASRLTKVPKTECSHCGVGKQEAEQTQPQFCGRYLPW